MSGEYDEARMFLTESSMHSSKTGYYVGRRRAEEARTKITKIGAEHDKKRKALLVAGKMDPPS